MAYEFTKVIVITRDHEKTIRYLRGRIPALEQFKDLDTGSNFVLTFFDADRSPYVLVNLQDAGLFKVAVKRLKVEKMSDPENPVIRIE